MTAIKRNKTNYPGVFFREGQRLGGRGIEKIYYIVFKDKNGKVIEEKAGRQYSDDMTPARASTIRSERIDGKRLSRKEIRDQQKTTQETVWTLDKIWEMYKAQKADNKAVNVDDNRYMKHIKPIFGKKEPSSLLQQDVDKFRVKLSTFLKPQTVCYDMWYLPLPCLLQYTSGILYDIYLLLSSSFLYSFQKLPYFLAHFFRRHLIILFYGRLELVNLAANPACSNLR